MTKLEFFAQAITQTMTECHYSEMIFESERMPRGFWFEVQKHLAPGIDWPAKVNALSTYYLRNKEEILKLLSTSPPPAQEKQTEQTLQDIHLTLCSIQEMMGKAINKGLGSYQLNNKNGTNEKLEFDLVPEPTVIKGKGPGRKLNRDFERLSVAVDKGLLTLFEEEKKKLRIPASRLLDSILWNHYGKPAIVSKV
jgi:hypothetical protein